MMAKYYAAGLVLQLVVTKAYRYATASDMKEEKQHAFQAIVQQDLDQLKRHPLLQKECATSNALEKFKNLKEYQNNTMLIYAADIGNLHIIKYLVEEVGVDVNE